jgi:plastocyanin
MSLQKKVISGLVSFALVTVFFSACRVVDASTLPKNPKVHMGQSNFLLPSTTIKKGQSLDLVDDVASTHVIMNGQWVGTKQEPKKEPEAPAVNVSVSAAGQSKTIGPFNTAGAYHIYCTVHQGMNLTITVQ